MADDLLNMMMLFAAVNSDPEKAKRLDEITAALREVSDARAALDARVEEGKAIADRAAQDRATAEAARADVAAREQKLKADTEGLASAQMTHQREVEAFGKMRTTIETDHDEREKKIAAHEAVLADAHASLEARLTDVAARETAVAAREETVERKHAALQQAMAA